MGLIDDQFKEINNHIRHVMQLLMTWYAFFVTGNIIAIGWIATTDNSKFLKGNFIVGCGIIGVFISVNLLGVVALLSTRNYFIKTNNRINEMVIQIEAGAKMPLCFRESPAPAELYTISSILMILSLVALLIFWTSLFRLWL